MSFRFLFLVLFLAISLQAAKQQAISETLSGIPFTSPGVSELDTILDIVAIVEEEAAASSGIERYDLLQKGQEVVLTSGESLRLGFLFSCVIETIHGPAHLRIGEEGIEGGEQVSLREDVDCFGRSLPICSYMKTDGGIILGPPPRPDSIVYGTHPLLRVVSPRGGKLQDRSFRYLPVLRF